MAHHKGRPRLPLGITPTSSIPRSSGSLLDQEGKPDDIQHRCRARDSLDSKKLGLLGVLMPGLAQIAPAFNLFFTTGVFFMASLADASVPLVFLISMVGMVATGAERWRSSPACTRAPAPSSPHQPGDRPRAATATGIITIVGYIIAFGGIYAFVAQYILDARVRQPAGARSGAEIVTVIFGVLVTLPVIIGLKFGIRTAIVLSRVRGGRDPRGLHRGARTQGGAEGLSVVPSRGRPAVRRPHLRRLQPRGARVRRLRGGGTPREETRNPRRNVPIAVVGAVLISGLIYVLGSYALVTAYGVSNIADLRRRRQPVPGRRQHVPLDRRAARPGSSSPARDQFRPRGEHPQTSRGDLQRRPRRSVATRPRAVECIQVQDALGRSDRIRRTEHRHRSHRHPGDGCVRPRVPRHLRHPGPAHHVRRRERRPDPCSSSKLRRAKHVRKTPLLWVVVPLIGLVVLAIPIWGDRRPGQGSAFDLLPILTIALVLLGVVYAVVLSIARAEGDRGRTGAAGGSGGLGATSESAQQRALSTPRAAARSVA